MIAKKRMRYENDAYLDQVAKQELLKPTPLFHVTAWSELLSKQVNDSFVLNPGPQGAEGKGVYFSQTYPRFTAAEGANLNGKKPAAVIVIEAKKSDDWWTSKGSVKKYGRPKTWHSKDKSMVFQIKSIKDVDGLRYLECDWQWLPEEKL